MSLLLSVYAVVVAVSVVCTLVFGGVLPLMEYVRDFRVSAGKTRPLRIRRTVRYGTYLKAMRSVASSIEKSPFSPDYIVAIQYGALVPAAELAKKLRIPVLNVEVTLDSSGGTAICQSVEAKFDLATLVGKSVIVVDNSIVTGKTLKMTVELIGGVERVRIVSCVVYRPSLNTPNYINPDYVLFKSKNKFKKLPR